MLRAAYAKIGPGPNIYQATNALAASGFASVDECSTLLDSAEAEKSLREVLTLDSDFLTLFLP